MGEPLSNDTCWTAMSLVQAPGSPPAPVHHRGSVLVEVDKVAAGVVEDCIYAAVGHR
jgi:hypothetical protein